MANLMSHIMNLVTSIYAEKNATPQYSEPMDFMPDWGQERKHKIKKQSPEQIKEFFSAFAKDQHKRVEKDKAREEQLKRPPVKLEKRKVVKPNIPKNIVEVETKDIPVAKLTKHGRRNTRSDADS